MTYQPQEIWQQIAVAEDAPVPATGRGVFARAPATDRLLPLLAFAAIFLGLYRHIFVENNPPLWFDELYGAVIATQPTLHAFLDHCLRELSGPFHYGVLWVAVKIGGVSNAALRFPSLCSSILAPLVILRWGHPDRKVRLIWAGLTAIWLPMTYHASEAKPYSMLVLLAIGQVIMLTRLLRRPSASAATGWALLSSLMILTHYHALVITGLQGLMVLVFRRDAFYWRALLPFTPTAAWMSFHLATILSFANPSVSFYNLLGLRDLRMVPDAIIGAIPLGTVLIAVVAGTSIGAFASPALRPVREAAARWDVAVALSGACATLLIVGLGFAFPSFSSRYLLPFIPCLIFGTAIWAAAWSRRIPSLGAAILFIFLLLAGRETANRLILGDPNPYNDFNFAKASRFIAQANPSRMIFLWDCPSATTQGIPLYKEVAGLELKRAGRPVDVEPILLPGRSHIDPNRALIAAASRPGDAILWTYDLGIRDTLGTHHPAAISRIDPRWTCRDFGNRQVKVIACVQRQALATAAALPHRTKPFFDGLGA